MCACVQEVYEDEDGECSFGTQQWDASEHSAALNAASNLVDVHCGRQTSAAVGAGDRRPWERTMERAVERLNEAVSSDSKFHRPPAKTDRLYAVLERGADPILVRHPQPPAGSEHLLRDNLPNIRRGTVASGRAVARDAVLRTRVGELTVCLSVCRRRRKAEIPGEQFPRSILVADVTRMSLSCYDETAPALEFRLKTLFEVSPTTLAGAREFSSTCCLSKG